jgi:RNA polymerase sigma-32 factor
MSLVAQRYLPNTEVGLPKYLKEIMSIPILSAAEEYRLAVQWRDGLDIKAAHTLVVSHIKLVVKIAQTFKGYGLPIMDLISEGNIGLMKAVKKFNPDMGYRLATYAMWWIKATIQDYILKSWSLVKIGTSAMHKKIFFNLKKVKEQLFNSENDNGHYIDQDLSLLLGVSEDQLKHVERSISTVSLQDHTDQEGLSERMDSFVAEDEDKLEDTMIELHDKNNQLFQLSNAINCLSERESEIVKARYLKDEPDTLQDLSKRFKVSRERIRQIEEKALAKIRSAMCTSQ